MKIPFWSDVYDAKRKVNQIDISHDPQEKYLHAVQNYRFLFWRAVNLSFVWVIVVCIILGLFMARFF